MIKLPVPGITLSLVIICSGLMLLPTQWQSMFYYDLHAIIDGQYLRLVSGHFMHSDFSHWLWNCLALLVLGTVLESRSKTLLLSVIVVAVAAVNALLLSPLSTINYYCGLSGILNTLLVAALWIAWQQTHSRWVTLTALLCLLKLVIELQSGASLLTRMTWPPYPPAHLAGAIGGFLWVLAYECLSPRDEGLRSHNSRIDCLFSFL